MEFSNRIKYYEFQPFKYTNTTPGTTRIFFMAPIFLGLNGGEGGFTRVFGSAMNPGVFSISVSETDTMHLMILSSPIRVQKTRRVSQVA